jgi:hypothetical protein
LTGCLINSINMSLGIDQANRVGSFFECYMRKVHYYPKMPICISKIKMKAFRPIIDISSLAIVGQASGSLSRQKPNQSAIV